MLITKLFSYFSTKIYVVGTLENRLKETVFEHPHQMNKLVDTKIFTILPQILFLIGHTSMENIRDKDYMNQASFCKKKTLNLRKAHCSYS